MTQRKIVNLCYGCGSSFSGHVEEFTEFQNLVNMNAGAIRDRLYDYIRVANDKKIKAIYMMLEDDISEETEWWNNPAFVSELEKEYQAWDSGKDKGYSLADIKAEIVNRKAKKHGR